MRIVFIDSLYLIALLMERDQWHQAATQTRNRLGSGVQLVTTYEVLVEFLASVSRGGPQVRRVAVAMAHSLMASDNISVIAPSPELCTSGLNLYAQRLDKRYSLTDCVSMAVMRELGITEVLTHDRDFENEGFVRLIR